MNLSETDLFIRFGAALAIGFMIGLQREYAYGGKGGKLTAGERTFALLSLSGCVAAMLSEITGSPVMLATILLMVTIFAAIGHTANAFQRDRVGITTEVAIVLATMIGVLCYWGYLTLAVAIGIATTIILTLKLETDRFVQALTKADISAALQMAVISAIILPVLPNRSFLPEPFDVLNPFTIWLMVVFISTISFLGYVLIKLVGSHRGIEITGLVGGLVSSTAVSLAFSERSRSNEELSNAFGLGMFISWVMMFVRVLGAVWVLNSALFQTLWKPFTLAGVVALLYSIYLLRLRRDQAGGSEVQISNPFDLGAAVKFGLLYAAVLLATHTAQLYFGQGGIYLSSLLSGLVNMNAITLSMAELTRNTGLDTVIAARAIIMAVVANTIVKGGIVLSAGSAQMRKVVLPGLILTLGTCIAVGFLV